jgi:hypothetical protein
MLFFSALSLCLYFGIVTSGNGDGSTHPSLGAPTAQVQNGTYHGIHSAEYNQDYFLGIPYAQAPVGELRFRNPASLNESWSGARPAVQYSGEVGLSCISILKKPWV